MKHNRLFSIVPVPAIQKLQQIGSIIFHANGDVRLGEHLAYRGAPLDGLVFAVGYEAHRRFDIPKLLHIKEPGSPPSWRTFEYRWTEELWYEHVEALHPELQRRINMHGVLLGNLIQTCCNAGMELKRFGLEICVGGVLYLAVALICFLLALISG